MKSYQSYQNQTKNVQNEQIEALFSNKMTFLSKVKSLKIPFTQFLLNFRKFWLTFHDHKLFEEVHGNKIESVKGLFFMRFR